MALYKSTFNLTFAELWHVASVEN